MCVSPILLKDGIQVACRECWQCRSNRVNDWVGRNIAENETATVSYAVTLTYGRSWDGRADHLRSVWLTASDIQKMLKRMRRAGMIVRYIVCGEYGGRFGRSHWHAVFHFYGDVLPAWDGIHLHWDQEQWNRVGGIHINEWASYDDEGKFVDYLGTVHIKKATYAHVKYALKYLLKDTGDEKSQYKLLMSRKPPLGYAFFKKRAWEYAQAYVSPQDLFYKFPIRLGDGSEKIEQFLLRGRMAEIYLLEYIDAWRSLHGSRPRPGSALVDTFEEFGRLGEEEVLTAYAQEKIPAKASLFNSDGTVKNDRPIPPAVAHFYNGGLRDNRTVGQYMAAWMEKHGEELSISERKRWRINFRDQAERVSRTITGRTERRPTSTEPNPAYLGWLNAPWDYKSRREAYKAGERSEGA